MSRVKREHEERLETVRSEDRQQKDQIARMRVALEESRKSEEEARLRSRRCVLRLRLRHVGGAHADASRFAVRRRLAS
jgi:hypothetical protein